MRLCTINGCERKHVAKGFCHMHYRQGKPRTMVTVPCDGCGKTCKKEPARLKRYSTLYCTPRCKTESQWRELWASQKTLVMYVPPRSSHAAITAYWQQQGLVQSRTFQSGYCRVCGGAYLTLYGDVTCRDECTAAWRADRKREGKHRRRALKRDAYRAPVRRADIYARDNYMCQICEQPLDMDAAVPHPHAPTIDHVRPLARGGTHEPDNVQAAHFICNAIKSDKWAA